MISDQTLSQIDLFEGIPGENLASIAKISEEITCAEGKQVFQEGSSAEHIYILLEGKVAIEVGLTSRPGGVTVAVISQPHLSFGWSGVIPPYHYTASAHCKTDSRLLAIPGQKLIQVLQQEPKSGFVVMQKIAEVIGSRLRNSRITLLKTL